MAAEYNERWRKDGVRIFDASGQEVTDPFVKVGYLKWVSNYKREASRIAAEDREERATKKTKSPAKATKPLTRGQQKYAKFFDKDMQWQKWTNTMNLYGGVKQADGSYKGQELQYKRRKIGTTPMGRIAYDRIYNKHTYDAARGGVTREWGADVNRHASYKSFFKGAKTESQIQASKSRALGQMGSRGAVLDGNRQEFERHLLVAKYQMQLQAANWRVLVGQRALKVFKESFKFQKFYSEGASPWQSLSSFTKKKRSNRGTLRKSPILREYGDLEKSLKFEDHGRETSIITQPVTANEGHHKSHTICYAGYHNDPNPWDTYGRWGRGGHPKKYVQRQFMGHSDKLNPITDSFMCQMMKWYLFDNVFLVKKV